MGYSNYILEKVLRYYDTLLSEDTNNDIIYSDNFKRWFGDWENNPEQASKIVDSNGKPMVCYHHTILQEMYFKDGYPYTRNIPAFDTFKESGGWFTNNKQASIDIQKYKGGKVYSCYLNIRNPYVYDAQGKSYENFLGGHGWDADTLVSDIRYGGGNYDGVWIKNVTDEYDTLRYPIDDIVAFSNSQIKSCEGNNGNFSIEDRNIYK